MGLKIQILSICKDSTPKAISKHSSKLNKLSEITYTDYGYDFFVNGPAKMIITRKEVPEYVVNDLFLASLTGNNCFTKFVEECVVTNQLFIYHKSLKPKGHSQSTKKIKANQSHKGRSSTIWDLY